jgi:hypothetical protein
MISSYVHPVRSTSVNISSNSNVSRITILGFSTMTIPMAGPVEP